MAEITFRVDVDEGRVDVNRFFEDELIYLEVTDDSQIGDKPAVVACVELTSAEAKAIGSALLSAAT